MILINHDIIYDGIRQITISSVLSTCVCGYFGINTAFSSYASWGFLANLVVIKDLQEDLFDDAIWNDDDLEVTNTFTYQFIQPVVYI